MDPAWMGDVEDHVIDLAWSPDGSLLAVATISGPVHLFARADGERVRELPGHGFGTTGLSWSPDGTLIATAGQDGKARLWDPETGAERAALVGGSAWVEHIAWCPDAPILATAAGRSLRFWQPDGTLMSQHDDHPSTIADIGWKPGAGQIAVATYGGLTLWAPGQAAPLVRHEWQGSTLVIAWSGDGRYIATGDQDSTVHFWIAATGKDLQMWGYPNKVRELSWNPSSRYLATGGGETIIIWDCSGKGPEGTTPKMLDAHVEPVSTLAFQHRGDLLASGGGDRLVAIWRPEKGRKPLGVAQLDSGITALHWSGNDRLLAAATEDGAVAVFRAP